MKSNKKVKNKKIIKVRLADIIIVVAILALIISLVKVFNPNIKNTTFEITPEIARSMEYTVVSEQDKKTNSEFVNFDAFFLKDLDGDGNAESIRGTCNEVGKEDTLYMELKVINDGYLKDAVITINSSNFYLNTTMVKDSVVAQNYISSDTKQIKLNQMPNGTQKLLTGIVRSGDYSSQTTKTEAIGNDTKKYSKVNSITFTGTHVSDTGRQTTINKTVNFAVDWYGTTKSRISTTSIKNTVNSLDELIDGENVKLDFTVETAETENDLILKANYLEGTIPELNGYKPTSVQITGSNIEYTYNPETNEFTAKREAVINNSGFVTRIANSSQSDNYRYNAYKFTVTYPKEAYNDIDHTNIELFIPVKTWYEGYNNPNDEFTNPYVSNISDTTIVARWAKHEGYAYKFDIQTGEYSSTPYSRYVVSKEKPIRIYNNISNSETEDYYPVKWILSTGSEGTASKVVMKETENGSSQVQDKFVKTDSSEESMEQLTTNVGIYFYGQDSMLGQNGWIKVYNDETDELIETFNKDNWSTFTQKNPYKYTEPIKHIRVETSGTNKNSKLYVYNIKELDDNYITTNYTKENFDKLEHIKSTLTGYFGNDPGTATHTAVYEAPTSLATLSLKNNKISSQETAENQIISIYTNTLSYNLQKWVNGCFLVKLPSEIIDAKINSISINNSNVNIVGHNLYEEDGNYFIKILTENVQEETYILNINLNMTPDPRTVTSSRDIELYAINKQACEYSKDYREKDIYDLDEDSNTTEIINKDKISISIIAPNGVLTHQIASHYDRNNTITVAPRIAKTDKDQRKADVEISISNNYSQDITDIKVQGVIPFEGNKYLIGDGDLGSTFSTWMSNTGITIPEELEDVVTIYYSTVERPTNDLANANNKWTLKENVTDWNAIKTYIIDFGEYKMVRGENHKFKYQINIPQGINYNEISYSEHAIYFSLMTDQGKYATSTAPNKLGFMIAKQYDLEITKYQQDTSKVLSGITFSVTEEGNQEGKIKVTNTNGKAILTGLYAEKTYLLKEIKTTDDYKLNEEEIKIYTYTDEQDNLYVAYKEDNGTCTNLADKYGWLKNVEAVKDNNKDYIVKISLENEPRPRLRLIKVGNESNEKLSSVLFNIKGEGIDTGSTTNSNGELTFPGLYLDKEYEITEKRKQGYYQMSPVKFKIVNNGGTYSAQITEGNIKEQTVETIDSIPQINLTLENEKIPTYNLQITKIEENHEDKTLKNAEFMLIGEDDHSRTKLTTNGSGVATAENLYQFVNGKDITGKYTLSETKAPNGYSNNEEKINLVVTKNGDNLEVSIENQDNLTSLKSAQVDGNTIKLTIQDKPLFKLIKTDKDTEDPIANAKFIIYEVDDNGNEIGFAKDINGNYVGTLNDKNQYEIVTNENGEVTIPLKNGTYKAIEIEAPTGYEKNPAEEIFKISGNEEEQDVGTPDEFTDTLEINYIEDLVDLSENVRNGNSYSGTKVILKRTLDFTDNSSYRDPDNTTTYGDYNLDGNVESIKTELTTGIGFRGIGLNGKYYDRDNRVYVDVEKPFSGIFDGQGNKINGILINDGATTNTGDGENKVHFKNNAAVFRYVKNGKIKRLTIGGEVQGDAATSGLVSYADNIEIYNCTNNCTITGGTGSSTILSTGKTNIIIEGCKNNGNIYNSYMSGAILAHTQEDTENVIIKSCENTVDIDIRYNSGSIFSSITAKNILVDDCKNYGNITATNGNFIGGIGYYFGGSYNETSVISNCINYGNIYTTKDYIGGIIYSGAKKIYNCINYGNIYGPSGGFYVGGITATSYNDCQIENCINYGNIEEKYGSYVGGIVGSSSSNIVNCANYGNIKGNYYISGIANGGLNSSINNCYNRGDLYCSNQYVGGINSNGSINITNSYSTGKIYNTTTNQNGKISYVCTIAPSGTNISNSYYLYGLDDINADNKFNTGTQITEEQLGSREFFDTLNIDDVWLYREGEAPVLKMPTTAAREVSEIKFTNEKKHFKIITAVEPIDGVKGGSISGEGETPYESVEYNKNSTKEIKVEPDDGYKIVSITINGKDYEFEPESDGTYTLSLFKNMLEDKMIVVKFGKDDQILIINKVDAETNEPVKGAEFNIAPKGHEIITYLNSGNTPYYFKSEYDYETQQYTYISNNATAGVQNTTANSLISLNSVISELGRYKIVVNASISSEENNDIGWATVRTNGPSYDNTDGRFIYISGEKEAQDYESEIFEYTGSESCYVVFGYIKNGSIDYGEDEFKINSVKLVNVDTNEETDITSNIAQYNQYDFKLYNGSYIPTNGNTYRKNDITTNNNTLAHSFICLTRSNYDGKYYLEVDASISSEEGKDIGYATIANTKTTEHGNGDNIIEFMNISGEKGRQVYKSEPFVFENNSQNYAHYINFVYSKDEANSVGDDAFVINSIKLCKYDDLKKVTTDSNGKANLSINPTKQYTIEEIKAPDGYILNTDRIEFDPSTSTDYTIKIYNSKMPRIFVNHYLWTVEAGTTETKVADSEEYKGHTGENYDTSPNFRTGYEIITNRDYFGGKTEQEILAIYGKSSLEKLGYNSIEDFYKDYYIPANSSGKYTDENQVVDYYYKEKTYTLTVKHLLEGTEENVPSKTGGTVGDEVTAGYKKNDEYETSKSSNVDYTKYELVETPRNAEGTIKGDTEVRYYYRQKEHIITTKVKEHNETNFLGETAKVKGGSISGEGESPYETVEHGEDSVKEIKAIPEENYIVKKITVNGENIEFTANEDGTVVLNKFIEMTEDKEVIVEFRKIQGTVIVHHYVEGTTNPIDLKNGNQATDETKTGDIGNIYATKPNENAASKYSVVNNNPEKASGTYINGTIEVTYYYRLRQISVKVNKEWDDNNNSLRIRPTSVKVNLKASILNDSSEREDVTNSVIPSNVEKQVTLSGNTWTHTWNDLNEYTTDSKKIIYSVEEEALTGNAGVVYSAEVVEDNTKPNEFTITNKYTRPTEKINFVVNKIWDDNSNENSKRPDKLVLNIYKISGTNSKTLVDTYTLNTLSESSHTFELDKYDAEGNEINYIAEEAEKRADDLYFYTSRGGERQEITLNDKKAYKSEFTNKFEVPDVKVNVEVTKQWSDDNNSNEKRPGSIKLILNKVENNSNTKVDEYTLNTSGNTTTANNIFSHTFENLPKYNEHGNEIIYTVDEAEVNENDLKFYSKQISETSKNKYKIVNTFTVPDEKIEIEATKVWSEENDIQKQRRPSSVTLKLMNGNTQVNSGLVNEANHWKVTFTDLAKYDRRGDLIEYSLDESEVTEGDLKFYTKTDGDNLTKVDDTHYTLDITNTFKKPNDAIELKTTKIWNDENDEDRLDAIKFVLKGDGQTYEKTLTSSNEDSTNSNNWIYTFKNLPKYNANGEEIIYELSEEENSTGDLRKYISNTEGYSIENKLLIKESKIKKTGTEVITSLDGTVNYKINYEAKIDSSYTNNCKVIITDTLPYEIDISKTYNLNDGIYSAENKTIIWEEDCTPTDGKITLTKDISLVYKDLPLNIDKFTNNVKGELQITNGVIDKVEDTFDTTLNFKKDITITKVWKGDTANISGRPKKVVIELLKAGATEKTVTLNSSDDWKTTFTGLEKYDKTTREEIEYTVIEKNVPKGYYAEITSENESNSTYFTITNNKYGTLKVTKIDKLDNSKKIGGAEFTLTKLKEENGKWVEDTSYSQKVVTTSNEESTLGLAEFKDLEYGKYRLKETKAPEGYELSKDTKDIEINETNLNVQIKIQNKEKGLLPATGAYAKGIIALIGVMLLISAYKIKAKSRKRKH